MGEGSDRRTPKNRKAQRWGGLGLGSLREMVGEVGWREGNVGTRAGEN